MIKKIYLFIPVLLSGALCLSQSIWHTPPVSFNYGEALIIEAFVSGVEDVPSPGLLVFYRQSGENDYLMQRLTPLQNHRFEAEVEPPSRDTRALEYYLELETGSGAAAVTWPSVNPALNPVVVPLYPEPGQSAENQLPLQTEFLMEPAPGARIPRDEAMLYLSYFGLENVDVDNIKVRLDNRDITSEADIRSNHLIYNAKYLSPGLHSVTVYLPVMTGTGRDPVRWSFTVESAAEGSGPTASISQSGRLAADHTGSRVDEQTVSVRNIYLDHHFKYSVAKIDSRIRLTSLEKQTAQPRNRYLFKISLPYLKINLGDLHPTFNRYGLNGNRVRGFQFTTRFKAFQLELIKGTLARAVQYTDLRNSMLIPTAGLQNTIANEDSLNLKLSRDNYTFKRNLLAVNLGIGSPRGAQWNLNFIKARDDAGSIRSSLPDALITLPESVSGLIQPGGADWVQMEIDDGDTTYRIPYRTLVTHKEDIFGTDRTVTLNPLTSDWQGAKPQDNLILGSDLKLHFDRDRIQFRTGLSFSLLNRNIWEPVLSEALLQEQFDSTLSLPFDPADYENIFHMGLNQTPLLPLDVFSESGILKLISHMPSMAYNLTLNLNYFRHRFQFRFQQIGPEFNSLANPYLQQNLRERIFSDRMKLLNDQLTLTLKYFSTDDAINLATETTTKTRGGSLSMSWLPGPDLPIMSLKFRTEGRKAGAATNLFINVNGDTLGISNQEKSRNNFILLTIVHTFFYRGKQQLAFTYARTDKRDLMDADVTDNSTYFSPENHSQTLTFHLNSTYDELWTSTLNYNYAYYNFGKGSLYSARSVNEMKFILQRRLSRRDAVLRSGLSLSKGRGAAVFDQLSLLLGVDWQLRPDVRLLGDWEYRRKYLPDAHHFQNSYFKARLIYDF
ncbi:MAG: hypothetical protein GXO91_00720 [FCB group bacterium]|nr:hypothetical protein [FCB group bacterium]